MNGKVLLALLPALLLGLPGCIRTWEDQGGVQGDSFRAVMQSQVLNPGPPAAGPPEGLAGPAAAASVKAYQGVPAGDTKAGGPAAAVLNILGDSTRGK